MICQTVSNPPRLTYLLDSTNLSRTEFNSKNTENKLSKDLENVEKWLTVIINLRLTKLKQNL